MTTSASVRPTVASDPVADGAAQAVALVAERLADPETVAAVASRDDNRDPVYGTLMWAPLTLSNGLPGVATFYAELARLDPGRWPSAQDAAHRHLRAAASMTTGSGRGLHAGPAAALAAAQSCAGSAGHYRTLRRRLADWLVADQLAKLDLWRARREQGKVGASWAGYDVINGLAGTGRLLLDAVRDPEEGGPAADRALTGTLAHLTALAEPIDVDGHRVPGWWVPPDGQPSARDATEYPHGDFNLGMAHGVPGPLWLLCEATARGHEVPGQRAAIAAMAEWLIGWTLVDEVGDYWPCRVSWAEQLDSDRPASAFTRTAWCYGAPGVAAALYRAGDVCAEPAWCRAAVAGLRAGLRRDEPRWALDGPTVCHGYAGLLLALHRVGTAAADQELLAGARRVAARVLDHTDPDAPFGFRHLMRFPRGHAGPTHRALDLAGLLEGAAGVACALLPLLACGPGVSASGPAWHRCLGMS